MLAASRSPLQSISGNVRARSPRQFTDSYRMDHMIFSEYAYKFRVGIVVFIATKLRAGGKQNGVSNPKMAKRFVPSPQCPGHLWNSCIVLSNRFQRLFLGG